MLQARDIACILILFAVPMAALDCYAQDPLIGEDDRSVQRLGEGPGTDIEIDPNVPQGTPEPRVVETAEQRLARQQRDHQAAISRNLAEAQAALNAGRIDQPPTDSAWSYYRKVLELEPGNEEAVRGLRVVQESMLSRALDYARELDFESADRILEDAALVRPDPALIQMAENQIHGIRTAQAEDLEVAAVRAMDRGDFARAERLLIELIALGGTHITVNQLRSRMEEARVYGGFRPGQEIRDHFMKRGIWTPESVVLLAGSFLMGSSAFEDGRNDNEGPEHRVIFRRGFALGKTEVTVAQFRQFVNITHYRTDAESKGYSIVYDHYSGRLTQRDDVDWELNYEGRKAKDDEPVVHVSWNDAQAYVRWLANGTGKNYRLPSEAEFEYALRGGKTTRYWWGDGSPPTVVENLTGEKDVSRGRRHWDSYFEGYNDKHWGPAPVASFKANPFGLYDIGGNVGEWVQDCWHDSYMRAPLDGSAWVNPGCEQRVIRGGYWASSPQQARSAYRLAAPADRRDARIGFRIARDL